MEITQVTTITLEDEDINALQTLKRTYDDCQYQACFECEICPLYVKETCIGLCAEIVLDKQK